MNPRFEEELRAHYSDMVTVVRLNLSNIVSRLYSSSVISDHVRDEASTLGITDNVKASKVVDAMTQALLLDRSGTKMEKVINILKDQDAVSSELLSMLEKFKNRGEFF